MTTQRRKKVVLFATICNICLESFVERGLRLLQMVANKTFVVNSFVFYIAVNQWFMRVVADGCKWLQIKRR